MQQNDLEIIKLLGHERNHIINTICRKVEKDAVKYGHEMSMLRVNNVIFYDGNYTITQRCLKCKNCKSTIKIVFSENGDEYSAIDNEYIEKFCDYDIVYLKEIIQ
jgi:hypothetical protein